MEKQWGSKIYCITAHSDDIKKVVRKKKRQGLVCHGEPMPFGGKGVSNSVHISSCWGLLYALIAGYLLAPTSFLHRTNR